MIIVTEFTGGGYDVLRC